VAVQGGQPPVIVELKRRFALSLVYQGIDRQRITDAVYLAVAALMLDDHCPHPDDLEAPRRP
jgi:hypothetical protein